MRSPRTIIQRYGYIFAVVCIVAATGIFFLGRDYFAKGQWALLYLLIIGLVAGLSGVRPALLAAVLAFLAWNFFFLPPFHTFRVDDPKDWLSLIVFLIVGVAGGMLTGRMREREAQALAREREMALLNEFSAHLVSDAEVADMADALLREISQTTGARCAILFLPDAQGKLSELRTYPEKPCPTDESVPGIAQWAFDQVKAVGLPNVARKPSLAAGGWPISVSRIQAGAGSEIADMFIPLQASTRQEGVLYIGEREDGTSYADHDARLLVAVANQAAAFLERKHLRALAVQADALREADKLKSTFVSSVSHELKTPLASITATVSNVLEGDFEWEESNVRRELLAVQEDLERLNNSIGSLVDLSRLEASAWEPKVDWYEFGDILGTTLSNIPQKQRDRVSYVVPEDLPMIRVDFQQWVRVVQNLLENALAYGGDAGVRVGASSNPREVKMWVEDEGPGIPAEERKLVFEKFYRGRSSALVPSGTGLGLAVTLEIVRFHGGRIWVEDVVPHGARFVVSLPRVEYSKE